MKEIGSKSVIASLRNNYDLSLPDWGPYSRDYLGMSQVPDPKSGLRWQVTVCPALCGEPLRIPAAVGHGQGKVDPKGPASWCHVWEASPDLSFYSRRHQLIWKDRIYADISFSKWSDTARLIRCECINATPGAKDLSIHLLVRMVPVGCRRDDSAQTGRIQARAVIPAPGIWVDALDYTSLVFAEIKPVTSFARDGFLRGEGRYDHLVGGSGLVRPLHFTWLANEEFGTHKGDRVDYAFKLNKPISSAQIVFRFIAGEQPAVFKTTGVINKTVMLKGRKDEIELFSVPVGHLSAGQYSLSLESEGTGGIILDGFAVLPSAVTCRDMFIDEANIHIPQQELNRSERYMTLRYDDVAQPYTIVWDKLPVEISEIHAEHLQETLENWPDGPLPEKRLGKGKGYFKHLRFGPFQLAAGKKKSVCLLVAAGEQPDITKEIILPFRNTLYTWDAGFTGLGLMELDLSLAVQHLNAYLTEPGDKHAAFILHGTPLPVQIYLGWEIWQRTQDKALLEFFYPRLRQFYQFLAGKSYGSDTARFASGLLTTWSYFYNSGGWDDYPPQSYVHEHNLAERTAPTVATVHAVRTAKILRMAAYLLGKEDDIAEYGEVIEKLCKGLQKYSWDEESGYFSYVIHDERQQPMDILRHESGVNFNCGLDGIYPLVAGAALPEQEKRLLKHMRSSEELATPVGISTVDRSAPYYDPNGYCNGALWPSHQWFIWKALLSMGDNDFAWQIANAVTEVWKQDIEDNYVCFESVSVETGKGRGIPQFGALSSPLLLWYRAYYKPNSLTAGFDTIIEEQAFSHNGSRLRAKLSRPFEKRSATVLVNMKKQKQYRAKWNGNAVGISLSPSGTLQIMIPEGAGSGILEVS